MYIYIYVYIYMYIYICIYNTNMCNLQYKQTKMIRNVVNLVNNTLMSIYWSGSCAIYLFILKQGDFFLQLAELVLCSSLIAPFSSSPRCHLMGILVFELSHLFLQRLRRKRCSLFSLVPKGSHKFQLHMLFMSVYEVK